MKTSTFIQYALAFFLLSAISCKEEPKLSFSPIEFELKGYDWDKPSYKTSQFIRDSIAPTKGNQFAAWEYAFVGELELMLATWDDGMTGVKDPLSVEEAEDFKRFSAKNAKALILEKAKETSITIINEAHQMPQHRAFSTTLLQGLYAQGYRHFGMEAFGSGPKTIKDIHEQGYPSLKNGIYVKDPQFGNLIREALKIGFKVFGYEAGGTGSPKQREIGQAQNIVEYMKENPDGKYFIHCGFAHAMEGFYGRSWEKAMASRLSDYTGINPLTIDQAKFSEKSKKTLENKHYQVSDVKEPTIFVRQDSVLGYFREGAWFDLSIFHPRTSDFNRPQWLLYADRKIVELDLATAKIEGTPLILAYKKEEEIGYAIPYDIQVYKSSTCKLVLEPGDYEIVIWDGTNKALKTSIKV